MRHLINGKANLLHTRQQLRDMKIEWFNPEKFVADNFEIVGELW
jgi:hypothetical protein